MKRLFVLGVVVTALVLPARSQSPDDQYVRIYNLIQEADALNNLDRPAQALPKFLEAQSALQRVQKMSPDWQVKVVNFRLNYLAAKIAAITTKVSGTATPETNAPSLPGVTTQSPEKPPVPTEHERHLAALQAEVRLLQADKTLLEAKLKEALATQPATIDPRELAKAQDKIQSLMKENDLLKTSLETEQSKPASKVLDETKKALAETTRELAEQKESAGRLAQEKEVLQSRMRALTASAEATDALRAENELLKKQVADLKSATPAIAVAGDLAGQLAQAQAQVAVLQSDSDILRLEKIALQNRVKQMSAAPAPATVVRSPNLPEDAERIKQLERERDDLQKKLETASKELYGPRGKEVAARVDELSGEIATLRARIEVFEARAVPYTTEELALFKPSAIRLAATDMAAARRSINDLPSDARPLVIEAQRHFSAREFEKAEAKYLEVLRRDDKNPAVLGNLAHIQIELNHLDAAERYLTQALAQNPQDAFVLLRFGDLRFRQGKQDEALDMFSRAAKVDQQNAEIQNYLGITLASKGLRGPAENALRKAIQLEPGYGSAHNNLAVIYATQPQPPLELARWHYQKALAAGHARNADLEKMLDQKSTSGSPP